MIREISIGKDESILEEDFTEGLGRLSFNHPAGTFALTPASNILSKAIIQNKEIFKGIGIDWGTGIGCLAILAAKINSVDMVYGLDISKENIEAARKNAQRNNVTDKTCFMLSDSYCPVFEEEMLELDQLKGKVDFIVSNPPSSDWDDEFGFRRFVMNGAKEFLKKDGIVLLNVSFQYGTKRVESLYKDASDFSYEGIAASTDWVPFDLTRSDLLDCLKIYAPEEINGGNEYVFSENSHSGVFINAETALSIFYKDGSSPLTKWQTHIFRYMG